MKDSAQETELNSGTRYGRRPATYRMISERTTHMLELTTLLYYAMQPPILGHHGCDRGALTCVVRHRTVLDMGSVSRPRCTSRKQK